MISSSKSKSAGKILLIPQEYIKPNPNQPRRFFQAKEMEELTQSVRENGIIQPISVRKLSNTSYELISGERRLRAARNVGLKNVPCILMNIDSKKSAIYSLVENLQRENLNFFEEANAINNLMKMTSATQEDISKILGCSQSAISNKIRLLKLSEQQQAIIISNGLSERHARCLLSLESEEQIDRVLSFIADKRLSVSDSEKLVKQIHGRERKQTKPSVKLFKDVRIFVNTLNHAVETMRRSGIEADSIKSETDSYIEYVVRIPKIDNLSFKINLDKAV
ncbi:MAG: ParB/RepB/Spo0J family partition protein [Oscillospiraceae bacterium]|nr:ParB/RepB/Spo0J family partition protein [Oscillospiraceae bacterium]